MPAMSDVTLDPYQQNDPDLSQFRPESPAWAEQQQQQQEQHNSRGEDYPSRGEDYPAPDYSTLSYDCLPPLDCSLQRETGYLGPVSGGPDNTTAADFSFQQDEKDVSAVAGCAGLRNLGNTCFLNSGLQCLLSNPGLVSHFLDDYQPESEELQNASLTGQFAMLLKKVWCGEFLTLHPSQFKDVLGIYHPQFKDYRQHDCQEFLALLMDSLHEQLNTGSPLAKVYDSGDDSSQSEQEEPWLRENDQPELLQDNRVNILGDTSANQNDPSIHSSQSGHMRQIESVFDQSQFISDDSVQSEVSISSSIVNNSLRQESIPETVKSFQMPNNSSELDIPTSVILDGGEHSRPTLTGAGFIENILPLWNTPSTEAVTTETDLSVAHTTLDRPMETDSVAIETPCVDLGIESVNMGMQSGLTHIQCGVLGVKSDALDSGSDDVRRLPSLEDLYMKDTKILNTNVLVSDLAEEEDMAIDSEKFHKVENTSASSETQQTQFDFEHLNDLLTLDPTKGTDSKPFKETNLLANVKAKFPDDSFPKKFLFSELMEDEPSNYNNIKRIKTDDKETNLKMQARMKVNTDKTPTKPINVEKPVLSPITGNNNEVLPHCSLTLPTRGLSLLQQGVQSDVRVQSLPPSRRYVQMADKAWGKHLTHNQSAIVNNFHGQFKSTVVCSECHHMSLTFEPFMYLSVPLPHAMERQISAVFVPSDNKRPIRYLVTLNKQDSVKTLKHHLVAIIGEESCDIIIAEVLDNHIARVLEDHTLLRYVNDDNRTIYAFEMLPAPDINSPPDVTMATQASSDAQPGVTHDNQLIHMAPNNITTTVTMGDPLSTNPLSLGYDVLPSSDLQRPTLDIPIAADCENVDDQNRLNNSMDNPGNQSWSSEDFRTNIEFQHNPLSVVGSSTGFDPEALLLEPSDEPSAVGGADAGGGVDQSEGGVEDEGDNDGPTAADQWKTCAICLEEMVDNDLMVHACCGGTLCHGCLEMTFKHYGDAGLTCPVCTTPVDPAVDFIPLNAMADYKPKTRILSVPVVHRLDSESNSVEYRLFGHPNMLYLPSNISAEFLYQSVDRVVQCLSSYIIILTDGQGLRCSRCLFTQHCSGCPLPRDGEISLQPGDHLTVKFTDLTEEQILNTQRFTDHKSMEKLRSNEPLNLLECFKAFTKSEMLDVHNPWYCPKCKKNQCANKTMTVWKYPNTLVVYLKRFVFHELSSTKIDSKVAFPLEDLDLSGFISGPSTDCLQYDLHSCICHFGGVNSGHYTSYAKHPVSGDWMYYNDESTTHSQPGDDDYSNAYVLFYQRRGTNKNFKLPEKLPALLDQSDYSPRGLDLYPSATSKADITAPPGLSVTDYSGKKSDLSNSNYDFYS